MAMTYPSVMSFERKLDCSDAFFWQYDSAKSEDQPRPVAVFEKSVRGTISNRPKGSGEKNLAKIDADVQNPNIQVVDASSLDYDCDTLIAKWSCKVLPLDGRPNACNEPAYRAKLIEAVETYTAEHGLGELARRYATNIANGRWLWRNRLSAERIRIQISLSNDGNPVAVIENAKLLNLTSFEERNNVVDALATEIEAGLRGERFIILYVTAELSMGYGQEVYPSQEMVPGEKKKDDKSKVLYQKKGLAGMHSQKIGNAIRTIDTWYPGAEFPIAAEPYGAVTTIGTAFRKKKGESFYSLLDEWLIKGKLPEPEQQHYVMSVLVRGGVFSGSSKDGD